MGVNHFLFIPSNLIKCIAKILIKKIKSYFSPFENDVLKYLKNFLRKASYVNPLLIYTMNVFIRVIIIFILVIIVPFTSLAGRVTVDIESPIIPVLIKKEINPVIKVSLVRSNLFPYEINSIDFDLNGTTDISDIISASVYDVNDQGMIDPKALLAKTSPLNGKLSFKETIRVNEDTISFWVSVTLKDSVPLDHCIQLNCRNIRTSIGSLKIPKQEINPLRVGVAVRQRGQDGVFSSRIPGLATTSKGTLLAIFDARYDSSRDLQGNIDIAMHRSFDKGVTWEPMQVVLDMGEWGKLPEKYNGVSDACVLVDEKSGDIYVAGLWMYGALDSNGKWIDNLNQDSKYWIHQWRGKGSQPGLGVKETCQFLITKSSDDGLTWGFPDNITSKTKRPEWWLFAPAPGHGITLRDGTLVFPTQGRDENGHAFSNITYSQDGGVTWITSNPAYCNVTECNAVQLDDGDIMLNMRDNRNRGNRDKNGRRICTTSDLGKTWVEHPTSRKVLVEPTCMGSLHRHDFIKNGEKKSILLFVNPSDYKERKKMTLKVSFDNGLTWPEKHWIMFDQYRSLGYSSITSIDEKTIGILFESSQADIAFIQIKLDNILRNKE